MASVAYSLISLAYLLECGLELGGQIRAAELAEISVLVGEVFKIIVKCLVIHFYIPLVDLYVFSWLAESVTSVAIRSRSESLTEGYSVLKASY